MIIIDINYIRFLPNIYLNLTVSKSKKGIFLNKSTLSNLPIIFTFYLTWSLWILIIYIFILVSLPPNIIQRIHLLNLFWIKLKWFHIMTKHWKSFLENHQTNNLGYKNDVSVFVKTNWFKCLHFSSSQIKSKLIK